MKKYIIIILSFFLCIGCVEDETVDVTVMPDITTNGADTFGCLVDGWLYVGGRYTPVCILGCARPSIYFDYDEENNVMNVSVFVALKNELSFRIQNPEENKTTVYTNAIFNSEEQDNGQVTITRFDKKAHIISGQFSGGRITNGRFDVHYVSHDYEQ